MKSKVAFVNERFEGFNGVLVSVVIITFNEE